MRGDYCLGGWHLAKRSRPHRSSTGLSLKLEVGVGEGVDSEVLVAMGAAGLESCVDHSGLGWASVWRCQLEVMSAMYVISAKGQLKTASRRRSKQGQAVGSS